MISLAADYMDKHFKVALFEIVVITMIVDCLIAKIWNSRIIEALVFVMGIFVFFLLSHIFGLLAIAGLTKVLLSISTSVLPILFQNELRVLLFAISGKTKKRTIGENVSQFIDHLSESVYKMSAKKMGGLILIEGNDSLDELAHQGTIINAQFSPELLQTIFTKPAPLHDGAALIQGTNILAAGTILPLTDEGNKTTRPSGTRHRAGIGISRHLDSIVIIISEENGRVSVACNGEVYYSIKPNKFKHLLTEILYEI